MSGGLEGDRKHNAECGGGEAEGNRAQRGNAEDGHLRVGVENGEQLGGEQMEQQRAAAHDAEGKQQTVFQGGHQAHPVARAVVIADNRNNALIEAKDRQKNKALKFEINAEHVDCRF